MRTLSLKEIQKVELEIFRTFDRFCRKNNINYSLGFGSMIGAVRHSGFIPWDDDIDIMMLRRDYNKFTELCRKNSFLDENKKVLFQGEPGNPYPFIKIVDIRTHVKQKHIIDINGLGIWIDIFPLDYCPNLKSNVIKKNINLTKKYLRLMSEYSGNDIIDLLKKIYIHVYKINGNRIRKKIFERAYICSKSQKTNWLGVIVWMNSKNDIYPCELFDHYCNVRFEDIDAMIFSEYDKILSHRYGKYMELPDVKERIYHIQEAIFLKV